MDNEFVCYIAIIDNLYHIFLYLYKYLTVYKNKTFTVYIIFYIIKIKIAESSDMIHLLKNLGNLNDSFSENNSMKSIIGVLNFLIKFKLLIIDKSPKYTAMVFVEKGKTKYKYKIYTFSE